MSKGKKITINKSEEIILDEREQEIYEVGYSEGMAIGVGIAGAVIVMVVIISIIIEKL